MFIVAASAPKRWPLLLAFCFVGLIVVLTATSILPKQLMRGGEARVLFFYFPQWHEIPENNRLWGFGFTDWRLLQHLIANPSPGHPIQVPTELGYYNLLNREVRKRQGDLLREYGGYGFIYHFYWFTDFPVMWEALTLMLHDGEPAVPFFFNWANEDWVSRWTGGNHTPLLQHNLTERLSRRKMFEHLLPFFRDPRYIRVKGKVVLSYYKPCDCALLFRDLDNWAKEAGLKGIFVIQTLAHFYNESHPSEMYQVGVNWRPKIQPWADGVQEFLPNAAHSWHDRRRGLSFSREVSRLSRYHWRGVYVNWDHSPRRREETKLAEHPYNFEQHLRIAYQRSVADPNPTGSNYLVVNGWNEWSEGNTMEPSNMYGRRNLQILRRITSTGWLGRLCVIAGVAAPNLPPVLHWLHSLASSGFPHWEALIFLTDSSDPRPVIEQIRAVADVHVRFVDLPPNSTENVNLLPRCHDVTTSEWVLFWQPKVSLSFLRGLDLAFDAVIHKTCTIFRIDMLEQLNITNFNEVDVSSWHTKTIE